MGDEITQEGKAEAESLRAEIAHLRAALADTKAVFPAEWKLTPSEERVFRVLVACDTAPRSVIAAGAGTAETRTIDVHVLRIRNKLKRFGVEIETVRGKGWRLVGRFTWARTLTPQS